MNYCTLYISLKWQKQRGGETDGDVAELLRKDSDIVQNITVRCDGTCQERGFTFYYSIYSICTDILRGLL